MNIMDITISMIFFHMTQQLTAVSEKEVAEINRVISSLKTAMKRTLDK